VHGLDSTAAALRNEYLDARIAGVDAFAQDEPRRGQCAVEAYPSKEVTMATNRMDSSRDRASRPLASLFANLIRETAAPARAEVQLAKPWPRLMLHAARLTAAALRPGRFHARSARAGPRRYRPIQRRAVGYAPYGTAPTVSAT
jgi:hypothetical protein